MTEILGKLIGTGDASAQHLKLVHFLCKKAAANYWIEFPSMQLVVWKQFLVHLLHILLQELLVKLDLLFKALFAFDLWLAEHHALSGHKLARSLRFAQLDKLSSLAN